MSKKTIWNRDFILVFIINVFTAVGFQMLAPTLPAFVIDSGYSKALAGIITAVFVVSALLIRPASGYLCDTLKTQRLLLASLVLIALAVAGYSLSHSVGLLIAFRLLHGFGWGITTTASSTLAAEALPVEMLGEGIGIFGLATVVSSAVAPTLGLFLANKVSYTALFLVAAAFALAGALLSLAVRIGRQRRTGTLFPGRRAFPGLSDLLAKPSLLPAGIVLLVGMAICAVQSFVAVYAASIRVQGIGLFFTVYAGALFVSKPLSGKLSDKINLAFIIYPCLAALVAMFFLISSVTSLWPFLVAAVLYGVGYGGLQPILQAWAIRVVGPGQRGVANSTFFIGMDLGVGIGSLIAGFAAENYGYRNMFQLMAIPLLVAMLIYAVSLFLGRRLRKT
jgi:MFS family permease